MTSVSLVPVTALNLMKSSEVSDDDLMYIIDKDRGLKSKKIDIKTLKKIFGGGAEVLEPSDIFKGRNASINELKDAVAIIWSKLGGSVIESEVAES